MKNCKEINPECIDCDVAEQCFIFRRAYKEYQKVLVDAVYNPKKVFYNPNSKKEPKK